MCCVFNFVCTTPVAAGVLAAAAIALSLIEPSLLGVVDKLGVAYQAPVVGTGYGAHLALVSHTHAAAGSSTLHSNLPGGRQPANDHTVQLHSVTYPGYSMAVLNYRSMQSLALLLLTDDVCILCIGYWYNIRNTTDVYVLCWRFTVHMNSPDGISQT